MKKIIEKISTTMIMVPVLALSLNLFAPVLMGTALAADDDDDTGYSLSTGANAAKGTGQSTSLFGDGDEDKGIFTTITNVILYVLGAVSVIMLIYGGIRYTISGGDSAQVTAAKNTIMYAIVGVVVAILAYAIINFVIGSLVTPTE